MSREDEIVKERERKIEELRKKGIEPYAYSFNKKDNCKDLQEQYKNLKSDSSGKNCIIAGRVISIRSMGNIIFAKLRDFSGEIQIVLQKDLTSNEQIEFFKRYIDSGDIIGVNGKIFRTKRGELSVLSEKLEILTKSVKPLPEKFHGFKDKEERYRKRYLDLIMNPEVKKVFEIRSKILEGIREFMNKKGFMEIETPLLQSIYGGASAKPFKTHCDAFNSDVFLSIAPELYLKKAMIGGLGSVYEITKKFRNEGVDKSHNPEHMTIEWYQEYADYEDGMKLFEEFMKYLARKIFGTFVIESNGNKIDLRKWERLTLEDAIKKFLKEDVSNIKTDSEAKKIAKKHGLDEKGISKTNLPDELLKLFREKIIQPVFLIDYPIGLAPLAKPKREDSSKAEIFQPIVGGLEIGRAYSELNDPKIQKKHFEEQENERKIGNEEAMPTDSDFVNALEYGLPPTCGVGIGIERLIMLFTNQQSIREVILFPFMKQLS